MDNKYLVAHADGLTLTTGGYGELPGGLCAKNKGHPPMFVVEQRSFMRKYVSDRILRTPRILRFKFQLESREYGCPKVSVTINCVMLDPAYRHSREYAELSPTEKQEFEDDEAGLVATEKFSGINKVCVMVDPARPVDAHFEFFEKDPKNSRLEQWVMRPNARRPFVEPETIEEVREKLRSEFRMELLTCTRDEMRRQFGWAPV